MEFDLRPDGRKKYAERVRFFELVADGCGFREAARIVGVNYRTTKHWRHGRPSQTKKPGTGAKPPMRPRPYRASLSSRFLSEEDRIFIADRLVAGWSFRRIAAGLERPASTISREVRRNRNPRTGSYRPFAAHDRALARLPRPKVGKIGQNPELRAYIQEKLERRWSPEQIARMLRLDFPGREEMHVVHETIYMALYVQGRGELRRELHKALRTGRARRKPRQHAQRRQPRFRDPMVMISERPPEVNDRAVPGHWEGDLIIGRNQKSAIGTLVERTTRYVMLVHLPGDHSAEAMRNALTTTIERLPVRLMKSLTWDQGSEMGRHRAFTSDTGVPVYFCDPASPWQRGSNENTNGLLRQYFPKGTDLSQHSPAELARVAHELNNRPRKTLDWETPAQRLAKILGGPPHRTAERVRP